MKKDIFNGKISDVKQAYIVLVFEIIVFLLCAGVFLGCGIFYDKFGKGARELSITLGILSFVCSIAFPVTTICFVRKYPNHKKFCHLLLKPYLFNNKD